MKRRNALAGPILRYKAPGGDQSVPERHCAMRAILATLFLCTAFACGTVRAEPSAETIARGKVLTDAGDCASCHTADPAKPFAGGKRIDTPFGGIFSPNLTPDRDTGIGAWSDDEFYRALHDGVRRDGSRYYPAFPYPNFTKLIRQDVLAIRAFLATLAPLRNTIESFRCGAAPSVPTGHLPRFAGENGACIALLLWLPLQFLDK